MTDDTSIFLTSTKVRRRYGDISKVTLHRWINDPDLGFPQPTIIGNRYYFRLGELATWEEWRKAISPTLPKHEGPRRPERVSTE